MNTIDLAVSKLGSQAQLAKAVGLTSAMAVSQWRRRGVPPRHCLAIQQATDGAVTVHDLRPDIFGPAPTPPKQQPDVLHCRVS